VRSFQADRRKGEIVKLAIDMNLSLYEHGAQARIARALGVNRSTINRAVKAILREAGVIKCCPVCGHRSLIDRTKKVGG
jgi:hypothetical protein